MHRGAVARVGLRPEQVVTLKLLFIGRPSGETVRISPLDGGTITGEASRPVPVESTADFMYEAGSERGRYRVAVRVGEDQYLMEFYVVDTTNPANNPPGVRIVD